MEQYKRFYEEQIKIDRAEFFTFRPIKLPKPFWDATGGPFETLPLSHWLILYDQYGIAGSCPCSSGLKDVLLPHLMTGKRKTYTEWYQELYWKIRNSGFSGESAIELGRLDIALHDILAKRAGLPLHRFLGADRDWVNVYASGCGTNLSMEALSGEVNRFLLNGYRVIKMKVATEFGTQMEKDLLRIKHVREMAGKDIRLAIDANQVWNADQAMEFAKMAKQYDIAWFEEPVHSHDMVELEKLTEVSPIPVAMGESMRNHFPFFSYIKAGVTQLQPVPTNLSGVQEWMKVRDMAKKYGRELTSGGLSPLIASFIATAQEDSMVEYLEPVLSPCFDIMKLAPEVREGKFFLPTEPGISVVPDFERLNKMGYLAKTEYLTTG